MSDLQTQFLNAASARKAGDAQRARALFDALLAQWPHCHEALYMHGMLSAELGDLPTAESRLRRGLELDRGNPEYLFRLGSVLLARGRAEEAVEALLEAEREAEETAPLMLALGAAGLQSSDMDLAERAFQKALELEPDSPEAGVGLLAALMGSKRMERALALGVDLARRHPRRADLQARLAQAFERANRLDEARAAAEASLAVDPREAIALGVRATLLQRAGRREESVEVFRAAIGASASRHERRELSRALGLVLDDLKRHDEAFQCFIAAKKRPDEIPKSSDMLAREIEAFIAACRRDLTPGVTATWPATPPDNRDPPVFFVGFPRSGTTLLEQMLGAHPRFVTTDEIQSLGRATEWVGRHAGGLEFAPSAYRRLAERDVVALRSNYWQTIEEGLGSPVPPGGRLLDKHPLNTVNLFTARRLFPGAKVIVSLRDPRDVILSCFMHLSRTPMAVVYFRDLESAARLYAQVMGLWFHMRTSLGLEWIEVKYEDVVEETEATARRVLEFLGEPWDDAVLQHAERASKRAIRSTSYQQVSQGIYTKALGRWRAYEPHFGRALEILQPFAEALGYGDR